jgi:hypothetical protein
MRDQFSNLYMGLHSGIYDRWIVRTSIASGTIRVRLHRIESYCGALEGKHAPGVSNFAQTPDGQRRNLTSNRYAIPKRSVFNSTS